jgi:hypothetical protein
MLSQSHYSPQQQSARLGQHSVGEGRSNVSRASSPPLVNFVHRVFRVCAKHP